MAHIGLNDYIVDQYVLIHHGQYSSDYSPHMTHIPQYESLLLAVYHDQNPTASLKKIDRFPRRYRAQRMFSSYVLFGHCYIPVFGPGKPIREYMVHL